MSHSPCELKLIVPTHTHTHTHTRGSGLAVQQIGHVYQLKGAGDFCVLIQQRVVRVAATTSTLAVYLPGTTRAVVCHRA